MKFNRHHRRRDYGVIYGAYCRYLTDDEIRQWDAAVTAARQGRAPYRHRPLMEVETYIGRLIRLARHEVRIEVEP